MKGRGAAKDAEIFCAVRRLGGHYRVLNVTPDTTLLRRYAEERSEAAFTELVSRHLPLVYHAALRQTHGDEHHAREVAQTVFTRLSAKAAALTQHPTLTGWLYTATLNAVREARRADARRQHREQQAFAMSQIDSSPQANWEYVRPVIDDALAELDPRDREAVLLRFFQSRPYAEIGATLHLTENSARMRVDRAVDKLRASLARRGVTSTAAALGAALTVPAALAVPAGLAQQISTAALASAAAAGTGTSLFILIKAMTSAKIIALSTGVAALVAVGVAVQQHQQLTASRAEFAALNDQQGRLRKRVDDLEGQVQAAQERAAKASTAAETTPHAPTAKTPAAPGDAITRDGVEARLKRAGELAYSGRYEDALKEYLWCYDTGTRQVEGYFLFRYSTLLDDLGDLAKKYPAAREALRERRDAARARLLASSTDMEAGKDFGQINRVLGDDAATYALFDSLAENDPRRAYLVDANIGRLMDAQRYRELAEAMPYAQVGQAWEQMTQVAHAPGLDDATRTKARQGVMQFAASQAELRAGAGDLVDANDMIERLLVFDNSPETIATLKEHLARAGHPELQVRP